jgi:hypothetical protein
VCHAVTAVGQEGQQLVTLERELYPHRNEEHREREGGKQHAAHAEQAELARNQQVVHGYHQDERARHLGLDRPCERAGERVQPAVPARHQPLREEHQRQ